MGTDNYSVLGKLGFELPPVGIKFSFFRPEGIQPLENDARLSLCEMMKTAQV
ncbi:MAG: hypothetical protein LBE79_00385 [Tannerella sp.]|jgi:hypothetical protein|nr:hypothetical protein [Tannerella sp.]